MMSHGADIWCDKKECTVNTGETVHPGPRTIKVLNADVLPSAHGKFLLPEIGNRITPSIKRLSVLGPRGSPSWTRRSGEMQLIQSIIRF